MNKKIETQEIKKATDYDYTKISDRKKLLQDFIGSDDRKYLLLFKIIGESDFKEAELLECLLLKTFDCIKDEMLLSDFYTKQDLADVNFFLHFVKIHINQLMLDDVDLSHDRGHNFLNLLGM